MSDVASWRLTSLNRLNEQAMANLIDSRRYLSHIPKRLAYSGQALSENIALQRIVLNDKHASFVAASQNIDIIQAKATVLVDISHLSAAQIPRLLWFCFQCVYVLEVYCKAITLVVGIMSVMSIIMAVGILHKSMDAKLL